jgi:hypothetical protein
MRFEPMVMAQDLAASVELLSYRCSNPNTRVARTRTHEPLGQVA